MSEKALRYIRYDVFVMRASTQTSTNCSDLGILFFIRAFFLDFRDLGVFYSSGFL